MRGLLLLTRSFNTTLLAAMIAEGMTAITVIVA
jgi:hypothetical protein